jgi:BirA family biotin operon repressor/biotin-[acetyl-CoA-carboxylase] ligase
MDQTSLQALLADLPLGSVRYFATVGSTNDLAGRWVEAGAPDLALVAADEQTAGRGRLNRRWITPPSSALAFSLVLKNPVEADVLRYTALGALAVCDALNAALSPVLPAQIKWPNDVIATRRKLAGVLAEAHWQGESLTAVILGIGINVAPPSVPPDEQLNYPATCVESVV